MDICELSPSYIRAIAPYQPGKPISELAREMGLDEKNIVKLASNENPLGLSPKARAAIERELAELARYPDGNAFDLKGALAARYGVPPEGIVVGNGSNDILELAAGAFLTPGSAAVYSRHAFAVYPLATQGRGARGIVVPARNYGHDLDAMLAAITPETRMLFVANPNNPTGTFIAGNELERFISRVPENVLVVLDEAYTEYLPEEKRYNAVAWLKGRRNLLIVRTFSKAFGLAGLRVGFGMMAPGVADLLNRVRQPFNVNSLALAAAVAALGDTEFVRKSHDLNLAGMEQLEKGLRELKLEWIPSSGNFLSFELPKKNGQSTAGSVYQALLKRGVIVRPVAGYEMPDHLRVTVGTREENEIFLKALRESLK
ncbi:MAG TPA: histidinol-phosphate transaminase [Burkholderiales bacterium]|nr:histidinol-phosphate transaminase [Burkholderiales bacterium]